MSSPLYAKKRHDRAHARLYQHHLEHPAWRELTSHAFKLICYLMVKYRPEQPNVFPAGGRTVADMISVDEKTGRKIIEELIAKGHLRIEREGRNRGQVKTRERIVSLTRFDTETSAGDPDLPIKLWRKSTKAEKSPDKRGKKSASGKSPKRRKANGGGAKVIPLRNSDTRNIVSPKEASEVHFPHDCENLTALPDELENNTLGGGAWRRRPPKAKTSQAPHRRQRLKTKTKITQIRVC